MPHREILSAVAIALTFVAFVPYIRSIVAGATVPHAFSWIIWALTTGVVFFAQLAAGGGVGAWPIGLSAAITTLVAVLAVTRRGDLTFTRSDRVFLAAALASLPLWYLTSDPLWSVVVLTVTDLLGFGPTVRKTWHAPWSEDVWFFLLFAVRNGVVLLALEQVSPTTALFPAAVALGCLLVIALILARRRVVPRTAKTPI
jgi:hypothetical protein